MLLAAKTLVLSRLLHKKLSQGDEPPPYLEKLRLRIGSLRRRLLARIDKRMGVQDSLRDEPPLEAMCAFALATTSSASDVLRHFLHVRQDTISASGLSSDNEYKESSQSLQIFFGTLKDAKAFAPIQLSNALQKLKAKPLLEDKELYDHLELNLDLHGHRLGDDIKTFTPYLRHDDLSRPDVGSLMQNWTEQAISSIMSRMRDRVDAVETPEELVTMRRQILELWLSNQRHVGSAIRSIFVNSVREIFVARWLDIINRQCSSLGDVGTLLEKTFSEGSEDGFAADFSLWSPDVSLFDLSDGAQSFRETLLFRSQGMTPPLKEMNVRYDKWLFKTQTLSEVIDTLAAEKWQDDLDVYDDELGDDQEGSTLEAALNEEDPRQLREALTTALREAFAELDARLQSLDPNSDAPAEQKAHRITFLLRSLRHLRQHLPKPYTETSPSSTFGISTIRNLYQRLASTILSPSLSKLHPSMRKSLKSQIVPSRPLWEGNPALPSLPSPWVFNLLQDISHTLADLGTDLWSPAAIVEVHRELRRGIVRVIRDVLGEKTSQLPNGIHHKVENDVNAFAPPDPSSLPPDTRIQVLLDVLYLSHALKVPPNPPPQLSSSSSSSASAPTPSSPTEREEQPGAISQTASSSDELSAFQLRLMTNIANAAPATGRMQKAVEEYWRRTSLLFGVLAG